jgi:putative ABC transport system permease protein
MLRDVRFGLRLLARQPGFAAAAVLTLALGIGANAAIFSVAWHMLLKPLPYPDADRLVHLWEAYGPQDAINPVAPGNFHDWEREARSFDAIAAYSYFRTPANLTGVGEPEQLQMRYVTGAYFKVFGMAPLVGRMLDDQDARLDSHAVVLSEGLWRRRFAADPAIVGRQIRLAEEPQVVVGVMPAAFDIAGSVDAWEGMGFSPQQNEHRMAHYLGVVGRMSRDVTLTQARADVKAVALRAAERFPQSNRTLSATVRSMQAERGGTLRAGLVLLAWAAGFVLLIACANLASLQLARGLSRAREFGIRAALGASRRRLVAQLLVESLLMSAMGAAVGLWLSTWVLRALATVAPEAMRQAAASGLDAAIVGYALALAVASAITFATAPAWHAATRATAWLGQRGGTGDRSTAVVRTMLVTGQIAMAVILLVGASELVVSLVRVLQVDLGFDPAGVLAFDVNLPQVKYDTYAKRAQLLTNISEAVRTLPGVTATCVINEVPFNTEGVNMTYVPEGQDRPIGALPRTVTPGCFDVLRVRLERGRLFEGHEATRVGLVTESFARAAWPGQDPIGRRVHLGVKDGDLIAIVGVVADSLQRSLEGKPYPQFYESASETAAFWPDRMMARADVPPASLFTALRAAVRRVDPDQPIAHLVTLEDAVGTSVSSRRFDLALTLSFAAIALLLAAVGLYGLLAQIVAQRTGEIGIRLALGATASSVVRLVMLNAWVAVSIGLAIGLAGAFATSRVLSQLLFGVSATDARLYAGVAATLAAVALLAAWWPARRAARIDPMAALRN